MNARKEINARDLNHYILRTPNSLMAEHNSHPNTSQHCSTFAVRFLIIFNGEVLQLRVPPEGYGDFPIYNQPNLNESVATFCHRTLQDMSSPGRNLILENPQLMEHAFKQAVLEPMSTDGTDTCMTMVVLVTVSARPYIQEPSSWQMVPLEGIEQVMQQSGKVLPGGTLWLEKAILRTKGCSRANLLVRLDKAELWMARLYSLMCYLESLAVQRGSNEGEVPNEFCVIIAQVGASLGSGFFLFEVSEEEVLARMEARARKGNAIGGKYVLKGVSRRRVAEAEGTIFQLEEEGGPEDVFDENGRLKVEWVAREEVEKLVNKYNH